MKRRKPTIPQPKRPFAPVAKTPGSAVLESNADKLRTAFALHQQGRLDQAEALYKEILQSQPQHFDALQLLATIARQRGQPIAAIELFGRALKINPNQLNVLINHGNALFEIHRLEEALNSYDRVLAIKPDFAEILNNRGIVLVGLNRPEQALASYDRAVAIKPDYAEAYFNRGVSLANLNRPEQALASYEQALTHKPGYAEALNNRGVALFELNYPEQALDSYERALAVKPDYAEALYNRGMALFSLKRLKQALDSYDRALAINPKYAKAFNNRGVTLVTLNLPEQALASYERALAIKPDYAEALFNRGLALFSLKQFEQALDSYDRALAVKPEYADALNKRGFALFSLKRLEQALDSYERALAIKPDFAEALTNRGNVLVELNHPEQALESYDRALGINPDDAEALYNRANTLLALKQPELALDCYDRVLTLQPCSAAALSSRGTALLELKRYDQALASYDRALDLRPDDAETFYNRGQVLVDLNRSKEALISYEQALRIKPDYAKALYNRGLILMELDYLTEAEASFRRALEIKPEYMQVRYNLAVVNQEEDKENLAALTAINEAALHGSLSLTNSDAELLNFALGRCYNDASDYETAFPYFLAGCKLKRATFDYDPEQMTRDFTSLMQIFDADLMDRLRGGGDRSALPIFVLGMPRSGTTLTEQIISSHPDVHGGGELPDLISITKLDQAHAAYKDDLLVHGHTQLAALGSEYVAGLQSLAPNARRITDKMPTNFIAIGLIHLLLPNAKIIHVNRNPVDTCLSCFTTWFRDGNKYTYDLAELGRYYVDYTRLMAHWRAILPNAAFLDVKYEELVADQEKQSRRIIEYCGLEWNDACLEFHKNKRPIRTASIVQVRQPIYQSSVERWRCYEKFLGPLLDVLGELPDDYLKCG
ncbi:MAG: tetratricopeptide repeat protein [Methylomonas sp.]